MYLTLEHLSKTFPERAHTGEVRAVDNVSLAIAQGEFVTFYLGPIAEYDVAVIGTVLSLTQYDLRQVYAIGTEVRVQLVTEAVYLLPQEA
jgi:hypothetical protein